MKRRSVFLEPKEGADTAFLFKLDFAATAGHNPGIAAPASLMIQFNTVHVEAGADLLDFPFVPRQALVLNNEEFHGSELKSTTKLFARKDAKSRLPAVTLEVP